MKYQRNQWKINIFQLNIKDKLLKTNETMGKSMTNQLKSNEKSVNQWTNNENSMEPRTNQCKIN